MLDNIVNADFNEVSFKDNTMLALLADDIHSRVIRKFEAEEVVMDDVTEEEYAEKVIEVVEEMEEDSDPSLDVVEQVSGAVVNAYTEADDNLVEEVSSEVNDMVEAVETLSNQYFSQRTGLVKNEDIFIDVPMKEFQYVDFSKFNYLQDPKVVDFVGNKGFSFKLYDKSLSVRDIVVMSVETEMEPEVITADELAPGTIEEIADTVADDLYGRDNEEQQEIISTEESSDTPSQEYQYKHKYGRDVYKVLNLMTDRLALVNLKEAIFSKSLKNGSIDIGSAQSCVNLDNVYPVFEAIKFSDDIRSKTRTKLEHNLKIIENIHTLSRCILSLTNDVFDGKLLLSENLINLSEYQKFQQHGGNETAIENYLRYFHNQNKEDIIYNHTQHNDIPVTGVSTENVVIRMDTSNKGVEALKNKSMEQLRDLKNELTISALESYIKKRFIVDENIPVQPINTFLEKIKSDIVRNPNSNLEDSFYLFLLDTYYTNRLESAIYTKTAMETAMMLDKNTVNVDKQNIDNIHLRVFLDLTTEFINNTFIQK